MIRPPEQVAISAAGAAIAVIFGEAGGQTLPGAEYLGFAGILMLVLYWQNRSQELRDQAARETAEGLISVTRAQAEAASAVHQALEQLALQQHEICQSLRILASSRSCPISGDAAPRLKSLLDRADAVSSVIDRQINPSKDP